ncbi:MAG: hypothetical protein ACM3Q9_02330 [Methanosarcina sp.]
MNRQVSRWRDLDWVMGRLSTGTLGRGAMRSLDELITAMNRLLLIAPEDVLDAVLGISVLLERFEQRDEGWREEWSAARTQWPRLPALPFRTCRWRSCRCRSEFAVSGLGTA